MISGMRTAGSLWLMVFLVSLAVSVEAPARSPDPVRGERLYATCSACHGVAGMGQPEGPAPVLAGQHGTVLLRQLADYRDGARWDPRMEHVAKLRAFSDRDDLADIAAFLSRLDAPLPADIGPGTDLAEGARVFIDGCASCHGASGQGDGARGVPRLAGQHQGYLRRQVLDAVEGRRPALQASHGVRFKGLSASSLGGLADYLSRNLRRVDPVQPR
jgi:cytochrome c553